VPDDAREPGAQFCRMNRPRSRNDQLRRFVGIVDEG
jgi:hypothetical protein